MPFSKSAHVSSMLTSWSFGLLQHFGLTDAKLLLGPPDSTLNGFSFLGSVGGEGCLVLFIFSSLFCNGKLDEVFNILSGSSAVPCPLIY